MMVGWNPFGSLLNDWQFHHLRKVLIDYAGKVMIQEIIEICIIIHGVRSFIRQICVEQIIRNMILAQNLIGDSWSGVRDVDVLGEPGEV